MKKALIQFLAIVVLLCSTAFHSSAAELNVGNISGATETYQVNDDTYYYDEYIGNAPGAGGVIDHAAGSNDTQVLRIGNATNSTGSYILHDGSVSVFGNEYIGFSGSGVFTQEGGTHTVYSDLRFGAFSGSSGTYILKSGTLNVGENGEFSIKKGYSDSYPYPGTMSFYIDGLEEDWEVNAANWNSLEFDNFGVGYSEYSNGSYELLYGSTLTAGYEYVGREGTGTFMQSGGTHTVINDLSLGIGSGSSGTYNISGGTLNVGGSIVKGSGTSTLNYNGGTLNANTINVDNFGLGVTSGSNVTYELTAGKSLTAGSIVNGAGTSTLNYAGGTLNAGTIDVDNLYIYRAYTQTEGSITVSDEFKMDGDYTLTDGTLKAGTFAFSKGGSAFKLYGGRLEVENFNGLYIDNSGGTLAIGSSPGTTIINGHYYQSEAGSLEIELGGLVQGTEYDLLQVNGTANLGGLLTLLLYDGYLPSNGDTFDILTANTIIGTFDSYAVPDLGDKYSWNIDYLTDYDGTKDVVQLQVSVVPEPISSTLFLIGGGLMGYRRFRKSA